MRLEEWQLPKPKKKAKSFQDPTGHLQKETHNPRKNRKNIKDDLGCFLTQWGVDSVKLNELGHE